MGSNNKNKIKGIQMNDIEFYDLDSITDYLDSNQELKNDLIISMEGSKENGNDLVGDPLEYKKIRKRRQNRESAARSRARKKVQIAQISREIKELEHLKIRLNIENANLKAENEIFKKELEFYKNLIL